MRNQALLLYRKNLKFFKKNLNILYELIRHSKFEDIELVFEDESDFLIKKNNKVLYDRDYVEGLKDKIKKFYESSLEYFVFSPPKIEKNYDKPISSKVIGNLLHSYNELFKKQQKKIILSDLNEIECMIVYGVGIGLHLEYLCEIKKIKKIILVEEEFENFLISLYFTDWEKLYSETDVVFLFDDDPIVSAKKTAESILKKNFFESYNTVLYKHVETTNFKTFINTLKETIFTNNSFLGFVDDELVSIAHTLQNIENKIPVLSSTKLPEKLPPLFLVASGPSLDNAIDFLKKNKDKGVVFAAGTALRALLANGITPDFEFVLERLYHTYEALAATASKEVLKKIKLIGLNVIHPEVYSLFDWSAMIPRFPDSGSDYFFQYGDFPKINDMTPTVTNLALAFGLHLGFKEVYLFGTDMGFKDPYYHHSQNTIYYENGNFKTQKMEGVKKVPGNFEEEVYTTQIFDYTRECLEQLIQSFPEVNVYNVSDGARIKGTFPCRVEDIVVIDKEKKKAIVNEIECLFVKDIYSKNFYNHIENVNLKMISNFNESLKYFETLFSMYKKKDVIEKEIVTKIFEYFEQYRTENDLFYILMRGTLYRLLIEYSTYVTRLYDAEDKYEFTIGLKEVLFDYFLETKKRFEQTVAKK